MAKKIKLGIDLDDTIWNSFENFFEYLTKKKGVSVEFMSLKKYGVGEIFDIGVVEHIDLFNEYQMLEEVVESVEFVLDFDKIIFELEEKYDLYFITARGTELRNPTERKLFNIFKKKYPLYFVHSGTENVVKSKLEYCRELGIDYFIDDTSKHIISCSEGGIKCFVIHQKWNYDLAENGNIIRVKSWIELIEKLGKITNGI